MASLMSISDVRTDLPNLVAKISNSLGRVTITVNGQPKAVLVSAEELESLEETAEVLAIPGAKESMKEGLREAKKGQGIPISTL
jgi:antitoxin YefM